MRIIHILADGTVKDDITGHQVNPDMSGEFYHVLSRICRSCENEKTIKEKN